MSHEDVLRKKLSGHRFVTSPVGIIKLIGSILFLVSAIISIALEVCSQGSYWLFITYPVILSTCGVIIILLYSLTILDLAKRIPNLWIQLDVFFSVLVAIVTLVFSILLLTNCTQGESMTTVTGVIGIIGTLCIMFTAAMLFIVWRNVDEEMEELPRPPVQISQEENNDFDPKRKSVFI